MILFRRNPRCVKRVVLGSRVMPDQIACTIGCRFVHRIPSNRNPFFADSGSGSPTFSKMLYICLSLPRRSDMQSPARLYNEESSRDAQHHQFDECCFLLQQMGDQSKEVSSPVLGSLVVLPPLLCVLPNN
jgi:hypothetical protein